MRSHGKRVSDGGDGRSVRDDRLKQYADPTSKVHWNGAGRDQENIDRWSDRASRNSNESTRASGSRATNGVPVADLDPPKLHSTGRQPRIHDTSAAPKGIVDPYKAADRGPNHSGGGYLKNIRRI